MKKAVAGESASGLIDAKIRELGGWRGKMLAKVREIIHEADAEVVEEWKPGVVARRDYRGWQWA